MSDKKQRRRFKVAENKLEEVTRNPCGESSPFHDFMTAKGIDRVSPLEDTIDVTRHYLSDHDRRDTQLRQITAALPLMTERQRTIIMAVGQGQTYREIAESLNVSVPLVQQEVGAARKIILPYTDGTNRPV